MIKFLTLFKTVATNFARALNTANEHNALSNERNRRFWGKVTNWAEDARKKAEAHACWLKAQAEAQARRAAELARKKAEQARAHARRVAAEAERKARQLAATTRAFVNTIQNKFGGFNGVMKAFRIGFSSCDNVDKFVSIREIDSLLFDFQTQKSWKIKEPET